MLTEHDQVPHRGIERASCLNTRLLLLVSPDARSIEVTQTLLILKVSIERYETKGDCLHSLILMLFEPPLLFCVAFCLKELYIGL